MSASVIASGVVALLVAMLLLPAIWPAAPWASHAWAASCNGASHEIGLSAPDATPRTGTPTTVIRFSVTYADSAACPPSSVVAIVPGFEQVVLSRSSGSFQGGTTFRGSTRLPVGTWTYQFEAHSGTGGGARDATLTGPGTIVISVPTPTPKPTPRPTPTRTPVPTPPPTPRPTPTPTPTPTQSVATPPPSPRLGSGGSPGPATRPTPRPTTSAGLDPGSGGSSTPGSGPSAEPSSGGGLAGPLDGLGGGRSTTGGSGSAPFRLPAFEVDPVFAFALVAWLLTTTGGVLLFAMMFDGRRLGVELPAELSVLVMKRRRAVVPGSRPENHPSGGPESISAGPTAPSDAAPGDHAVRRPGAGTAVRAPLQFSTPPVGGAERRIVAYQSVRVSATPDDLRSAELTRITRRDEVEVIGEAAGSLRIRTPDGIEGWVPRVVLVGPSVDQPNPWSVAPPEPSGRRRRWMPALRLGAKATRSVPPPAAPPA